MNEQDRFLFLLEKFRISLMNQRLLTEENNRLRAQISDIRKDVERQEKTVEDIVRGRLPIMKTQEPVPRTQQEPVLRTQQEPVPRTQQEPVLRTQQEPVPAKTPITKIPATPRLTRSVSNISLVKQPLTARGDKPKGILGRWR